MYETALRDLAMQIGQLNLDKALLGGRIQELEAELAELKKED